ncbi:MAG TPA: MauE/DoxX family redox-associated membrane protein [Actinomycetota bacterium]
MFAAIVLGAAALGLLVSLVVPSHTADAWSGPLVMATAVLVASGAAKVLAPTAASDALGALGAPAGLPLVRTLGVGEVILGVAAVLAGGPVLAAGVSFTYLAFAVVAWRMSRSSDVRSCGCFGASGARPGLTHVVVDVATALLAGGAAAAGSGGAIALVSDSPAWGIPALAGSALGAAAAIALLTVAADTAAAVDGPRPAPTTFHLVDESR